MQANARPQVEGQVEKVPSRKKSQRRHNANLEVSDSQKHGDHDHLIQPEGKVGFLPLGNPHFPRHLY